MPQAATTPHARLAARLAPLSRVVRVLTLLSLPLTAVLPLAFLLLPAEQLGPWLDEPAGLHLLPLMQAGLTPSARAHVALACVPAMALGAALLWQLWRLFGEYQQGRVFGPVALRSLKRFGALLLTSALAAPLLGALLTVAASWDNPPGQRMLSLSIGSDDWLRALLALVFLALAKVMQEAARVAEENEQFV